jgi:lipopolysaccharide export system permease protein
VALQEQGWWLLQDVTIKRLGNGKREHKRLDSLRWKPFLGPDQLRTLQMPIDSLAVTQLYRHARHLRQAGRDDRPYRVRLWRKAGILLLTLGMTLTAIPFAARQTPRTGPGPRLIAGALTGIALFMTDQLILRGTSAQDWSPPLVALGPPTALMAIVAIGLTRRDRPSEGG